MLLCTLFYSCCARAFGFSSSARIVKLSIFSPRCAPMFFYVRFSSFTFQPGSLPIRTSRQCTSATQFSRCPLRQYVNSSSTNVCACLLQIIVSWSSAYFVRSPSWFKHFTLPFANNFERVLHIILPVLSSNSNNDNDTLR